MDDLIVTGSSFNVIEVFKVEMKRKFDMRNLGSLSSYLGIEVKQGKNFSVPNGLSTKASSTCKIGGMQCCSHST